MLKFIIITFLQTFIFVALSSALDHNQKVKSDALKAMQRYDTKSLNSITKKESSYIKSDAKLQKMIDAYYEEEARELEVIKGIIANKSVEKVQENNISTAKAETATSDLSTEARPVVVATPKTVVKPTIVPKKVAKVTKPKKVTPKAVKPKPVTKVAKIQKPKKVAPKSVPKKVSTPVKVAKKTPVVVPVAAVVIPPKKVKKSSNKVVTQYLMGQWKENKKKKKIVLKMMPNNRFILEEKANNGILKLEGHYNHDNDNLTLDISKITYNVRSRDAAVHRIYKFKNISKKKMVLLDEKGEIVYEFER